MPRKCSENFYIFVTIFTCVLATAFGYIEQYLSNRVLDYGARLSSIEQDLDARPSKSSFSVHHRSHRRVSGSEPEPIHTKKLALGAANIAGRDEDYERDGSQLASSTASDEEEIIDQKLKNIEIKKTKGKETEERPLTSLSLENDAPKRKVKKIEKLKYVSDINKVKGVQEDEKPLSSLSVERPSTTKRKKKRPTKKPRDKKRRKKDFEMLKGTKRSTRCSTKEPITFDPSLLSSDENNGGGGGDTGDYQTTKENIGKKGVYYNRPNTGKNPDHYIDDA